MVEYSLTAHSPLNGYREIFENTVLEEIVDLCVLSMAIPLGGATALNKALTDLCGTNIPATGKIVTSKDGNIRFLGMASDQVFLIFSEGKKVTAEEFEAKLNGLGYFTNQSDNWVQLRISGDNAVDALARICPLDLDPTAFPADQVSRTVMEHLGTIILRDGDNAFILMAASSSAATFVHAVETSIRNVN